VNNDVFKSQPLQIAKRYVICHRPSDHDSIDSISGTSIRGQDFGQRHPRDVCKENSKAFERKTIMKTGGSNQKGNGPITNK
jgi:hypothetical protein